MNAMPMTTLSTEFAPAERVPIEIVHRQAEDLAHLPLISELLNSVLGYVLILNEQRQVVFASENLRELVPGVEPRDWLGKRPGELLGCIHASQSSGGCGTTAFCRECGAVKTILNSLAGRKDCQECRMIRVAHAEEEAMDLLVSSSPLKVNGETYALMAVADISHEKRRRALERIFFHDVINAAGGLEGRILMLDRRAPEALHDQIRFLRNGVHDVLEEILAQRDLVAAESNELQVDPRPLASKDSVQKVVQLYANHPVAEKRTLRLDPRSSSQDLVTDPRLLRRILGNLIKNALEASKPGDVVTAGCTEDANGVRFQVHNPTFMPPSVQVQIFNRSFTTKGSGRGLGTYSVKLLAERYLQGKVGFTTSEGGGTTFWVRLPLNVA